MNPVDIVGWLAAAFTLATFSMKTMIPLRLTAILSNIAFVAYGTLTGIYPIAALHCLLLPFNLFRLVQIRAYFKRFREAYSTDFSLEWIRPVMCERTFKTGNIIFRKGDQADYFYYLAQGRVQFPEICRSIGPGEIFGEIAFLLQVAAEQ
ncbi:MAG: cyclic nucleotide-binding domain-containing protein [Hyphomicrobiaceae bacterium]